MFTEPNWAKADGHSKPRGWIEVITGCMFSGKTEELIRRINRAIIARQEVKLFKPAMDTRYHLTNIVSHNSSSVSSIPVNSSEGILNFIEGASVVGIDEVQFFDKEIVAVCNTIANQGIRVIVAGLDMDYTATPFESMPYLMAIAEFVTKVNAICSVCGGVASYSYRLTESKEKVLLGEKDIYEPRCRECFNLNVEC